MNQTTQFLTVKTGTAAKTGERSNGGIGYRVLTDADKRDVYIRIESNDGSGYFSRELLPFSKIEACLLGMESCQTLPAKTFRPAFTGKSSNNAGFLAAILRTEGLMAADMNKGYSHRVSADWSKWKSDMLALNGEPFTVPPPEEKNPVSDAAKLKAKESVKASESAEMESATGKRKQRKESTKEDRSTDHDVGGGES